MKKKILLIVPDSIQKPLGGMGVGSMHFVRELSSDFDFNIVGYSEDGNGSNYRGAKNPLPTIAHGALATLMCQGSYFEAGLAFEKPDLVHAYDWSIYLAGMMAADYYNVPLVVSMRLSINLMAQIGLSYAMDPRSSDGYWIHKGLCDMEMAGLSRANHITQVSEAYAKKFENIPGLKEKTSVVPNGIGLSAWQTYTKKVLPGTRKYKVGYIGRFAAMKNVLALLEARLPDNIDLIFIGSQTGAEPQIYEVLQQKTRQQTNMFYIGPTYGQDKIDTLRSLDAVIMPSLHEPFGIVALEALAAETILLSSFMDGMSDFLTPEIAINCGLTRESIELGLKKFSEMSDEEKSIRKQKGLEVCKHYSWQSAAEKMKAVYKKFV